MRFLHKDFQLTISTDDTFIITVFTKRYLINLSAVSKVLLNQLNRSYKNTKKTNFGKKQILFGRTVNFPFRASTESQNSELREPCVTRFWRCKWHPYMTTVAKKSKKNTNHMN